MKPLLSGLTVSSPVLAVTPILLTDAELQTLTGYRRPSKQIDWLRQHGVRFMVGADGRPRVLRAELETRHYQPRREPNFQALRRAR